MCQNNVNHDQMRQALEQTNATIGLAASGVGQLSALADRAGDEHAGAAIARAAELLGKAQAELEHAAAGLESGSGHSHVHVELV